MTLLAGDIGGTKTFLSLGRATQGGIERLHEARYTSAQYADLAPMVREFLASAPPDLARVDAACFALAGPIQGDETEQRARLTNLPWRLDSRTLASTLDIPHVRLINDFAAVGHGLASLAPESLAVLQAGSPDPTAPRLVLGAGTGLGVCTLCPIPGGAPRLLAAEAGHANFSPANARQLRLAQFVLEREGRCSREHVLSGAGLRRVYEFVCAEAGRSPAAVLATADPPATVAGQALAGEDDLAVEALTLFVEIYAGQAADLALAVLPFGGVYLAGGVAPKILPRLQQPDVVAAFNDRPPMAALLAAMPLQVILEEHAGLIGALAYARITAETASGGPFPAAGPAL